MKDEQRYDQKKKKRKNGKNLTESKRVSEKDNALWQRNIPVDISS